MGRIIKPAGQRARNRADDRSMHGSWSEWRLFAQPRGETTRGNSNFFALGPSRSHGKATPKNPGRGRKS